MHRSERIFVVPWDGDRLKTYAHVQRIYPDADIIVIEKKELRQSSPWQFIQRLKQFRGRAVVYCFQSLEAVIAPLVLAWSGLFHHCRETVLVDETGNRRGYGQWSWVRLLPITLISLACDAVALLHSFIVLSFGVWRQASGESHKDGPSSVAYLFPVPMARMSVGGAMTHVRGFLSGLRELGIRHEVYSGTKLNLKDAPEHLVPLRRRPFFFWEARALAYNWRFVRAVRKQLAARTPAALYHRHGRFVIAGALLARKLKSPLILEYNGSEVWVAKNWDPSRFKVWLRLCEEYSIRSATLIVVVSEPLKRELMNRGITEERIVVTPNGVDAALFQPAREAGGVREALGFSPDDVVAAFVGSFSYWHGIPVLQDAADRLLAKGEEDARLRKLRFLLVGDGLLKGDATTYLQRWIDCGKVVFTGNVPHSEVPAYLDAADILLSPHVPFADGSEFFGSPTKLFEYMAMQKAIVASNLGQIGQVLSHQRTGWLVKPGSVDELVEAIAYLAVNPLLRERLGREARAAAQVNHSWKRNAEVVFGALQTLTRNCDGKTVSDKQETQPDSLMQENQYSENYEASERK